MDPQEYARFIAQMILQSAAAQREQEASADRLAIERERLGLERQSLAQQSKLTDERILSERADREAKAADRKEIDRQRAIDFVEDETYRFDYGESPTQTKLRLGRRKGEAEASSAESTATTAAIDAEAAPERIKLGRLATEAQIEASKAATEASRFEVEDRRSSKALIDALRESQVTGQNIQNQTSSLALAEARRSAAEAKLERIFAARGIVSPAEKTKFKTRFINEMADTLPRAAIAAGETVDQYGNKTYDAAKMAAGMEKASEALDVAIGMVQLQEKDPALARENAKAIREAASTLMSKGASREAVGEAMVSLLKVRLPKKAEETATPKEPPPETESEKRGRLRREESEAKTKRASSNRREVVDAHFDDVVDDTTLAALEQKYGDAESVRNAVAEKLEEGLRIAQQRSGSSAGVTKGVQWAAYLAATGGTPLKVSK